MKEIVKKVEKMAKELLPSDKYDSKSLPLKKGGKKLCKADMHLHTWFSKEYIPGGKNIDHAYDKLVNFLVYWINKVVKIFNPIKGKVIHRKDLKTFTIYYRIAHKPITIVKKAKKKGLSFVAITDHDTIDGWKSLLAKYPEYEDFVIKGEEVSVKCYKTGIKAHVNVYELNEQDHVEIQKRKKNLPRLVEYLKKRKLLYSLNHIGDDGCWIRRKITFKEIDKYFKYFNVIEGRNGLIFRPVNLLNSLLAEAKGVSVIAGSDSHANRVGETYTMAYANNKKDFLNQIRKGKTFIGGRDASLQVFYDEVMDRFKYFGGMYFNDKPIRFDTKINRAIAKFMKWFIKRKFLKLDEDKLPGREIENIKVLYEYVRKLYLSSELFSSSSASRSYPSMKAASRGETSSSSNFSSTTSSS
jgi:predicted metal-dependent phosphoesterase TrpH